MNLQGVVQRLAAANMEDAARIGGALHDQAGQLLAVLHNELDELAADYPVTDGRVREMQRHLAQVEMQLRELAHEVHPAVVEDLGLTHALESLADKVSRRTGITIEVSAPPLPSRDMARDGLLYRVVQEALTNVVKHAGATRTQVVCQQLDGSISLSISDDGRGIRERDLASTATRASALGLRTMSDRIEAMGGRLTVASAPGHGTHLQVNLPGAHT